VAGRPATDNGKNIEVVNTANHGNHLNVFDGNGPDAKFGTPIVLLSLCEFILCGAPTKLLP